MATPVVIQITAETGGAAAAIKDFFGGFQNGLNQIAGASQFLGGMASQLVAAFSIGAIVEFTRRAISNAEEVGKMSQRIGIATETLSELTYSARIADVNTADLEFGLKNLSRQIADAASGNQAAAATFENLGVAVKNSDGSLRSTDAILMDVAEKFRGFKDDANKTALAMELFGRSGQNMIPFLNQGAVGIGQLRQEAQKFGVVISNESAKSSEDFSDNIKRLRAILEGLFNTFAQQILPILTAFSQMAVQTTGDTTALAAAFSGLAYVFKLFAGGAIVVNGILEALGKQIGFTAAIIPELLQGHLSTARSMNQQLASELQAISDKTVDSLDALWSKPRNVPLTVTPTISAPAAGGLDASKTRESESKRRISDLDAEFKVDQDARALELDQLKHGYQERLVTMADYFAKRRALIQEGIDEAKAAPGERITAIDAEVGALPKTTEGNTQRNALLAERQKLVGEIAGIDLKSKQELLQVDIDSKDEVLRIAKQNAEIEVSILQAKGQKLLATEKQIAEKYAELRRQPGANLDSVNEAERLELVQARVTDQTDRATLSQNTYQQAVQTTNALKESGQITELEAQERNNASAATYLQTLRMELEVLQQIAAAYPELTGIARELENAKAAIVETQASIKDTSFTGTLIDGLRQIGNEWGNLGRSMAQWTTGTMRNVFGNLGTYIMDAATKTKTWGQTFTQVGRQIVTSLINILGQYIASKLAMMAIDSIYHTKKKAENASSTAGGLKAGVGQAAGQGGWVGVLIYIAIVAAAMAAMGALAASVSGGFAKGGPVIGEQIARIGEEGPEFVFSAPAVRNLGMDNLAELHASAREGRIPLNREPLAREPLNREPVIQLPRFVMTLADGGPVLSRQIAQIGEAGSEFVFSAPAVQNLGMDYLSGLHASAREGRTMASGGGATGGGATGGGYGGAAAAVTVSPTPINMNIILDPRKIIGVLQNSAEGENWVVDVFSRNKLKLGISG